MRFAASTTASHERGRCYGAIATAFWLASALTAIAEEGPGARVTLLSMGSRTSVVVEFDDDTARVATVVPADEQSVVVEIGPVRGNVVSQLLEAPANAQLVRQVRLRSVRREVEGAVITVQIATKGPVVGSARLSRRRVYVDLEPRNTTLAARRTPAQPLAGGASSASRSMPKAAAPTTPATQPAFPTGGPTTTAGPPPTTPSTAPLMAIEMPPTLPDTEWPALLAPEAPQLPAQIARSEATPLITPPPVVPPEPMNSPPSIDAPASVNQPVQAGRAASSSMDSVKKADLKPSTTVSRANSSTARPVAGGRAGAIDPIASNRPAWPAPPAPARIRFVRSLSPRGVRGRPSVLARLVTALVGNRVEPTMVQPYGIAVSPDRRVFVADTTGGLIHVYNIEKSAYSTLKIDARSLVGIAFVGNRMVVTDSEAGRVICLDQDGHEAWSLGRRNGFERPTGIAAAGDRLFVVDTMKHHVVVVSAGGSVLGTFGGRGSDAGQFNFPTNIARSPDGRLFVTDTMNFRVQVFDGNGRHLSSFGQLGDGTGDFDRAKGIALDSAGHVYVVEGLHDVVQIFDEGGRLLLSFGGSGAGDGQLWLPSGIAIANDVVYVADASNRRVQMFEYLKEPR